MSALLLPEWQCHKRVRAAQIVAIKDFENGSQELEFGSGVKALVDATWVKRHNACVGGYYVVYEDGYASFSPRAAFEGGYTLTTQGA